MAECKNPKLHVKPLEGRRFSVIYVLRLAIGKLLESSSWPLQTDTYTVEVIFEVFPMEDYIS